MSMGKLDAMIRASWEEGDSERESKGKGPVAETSLRIISPASV